MDTGKVMNPLTGRWMVRNGHRHRELQRAGYMSPEPLVGVATAKNSPYTSYGNENMQRLPKIDDSDPRRSPQDRFYAASAMDHGHSTYDLGDSPRDTELITFTEPARPVQEQRQRVS